MATRAQKKINQMNRSEVYQEMARTGKSSKRYEQLQSQLNLLKRKG